MLRVLFATALLGIAPAWAQEPAKAIFVPAREVAARLQSARPEAPGVAVARVTEGPNYHVLLVRRTAPGPAEVDRNWSEICTSSAAQEFWQLEALLSGAR